MIVSRNVFTMKRATSLNFLLIMLNAVTVTPRSVVLMHLQSKDSASLDFRTFILLDTVILLLKLYDQLIGIIFLSGSAKYFAIDS